MAAIVATTLVLAGCGESAKAYRSGSSLSSSVLEVRGQVVHAEPGLAAWTSQLPAGTRATRMVYRSASGVDGGETQVSGAVFIPAGDRPSGGWPVLAYAHGTTGITRDCGPSDQDSMFGDLHAVRNFVTAGYAVVTTDYQGLGVRAEESAPHPYLEPRTAAYNVIDAVRAARSIEPTVAAQWVGVGMSQGGAAVWSTAEASADSASGADGLLGVVAVSPLLDARYLVRGASEESLTPAQRFLYPLLVAGVRSVNMDSLLHGSARAAALQDCSGGATALIAQRTASAAGDLVPSSSTAAGLTSVLGSYALPQQRAGVPILAIYGSADDVIPESVMDQTLARGCALGDDLQRVRRDGQGHTLDPGPVMAEWVHDRFAGRPTNSDC